MISALQNNDAYIGQLLIHGGAITPRDLKFGLEEQRHSHEHLCATLVRLGLASEDRVFSILSLQIGVPFVNLKDCKIDPILIARMPAHLARMFKCLVLRIVDDAAFVAMADPLNAQAVQDIQSYLGVSRIKCFLAGDADIASAQNQFYGS